MSNLPAFPKYTAKKSVIPSGETALICITQQMEETAMARITLADEFASLYGRVGDVVIVRRWRRHYMRPYVKPENPNTAAQREQRGAFREAVKSWQALPETQRQEWNRRARREQRSGYNAFLSHCLLGADTSSATEHPVVITGMRSRARFLRHAGNYRSSFAPLSRRFRCSSVCGKNPDKKQSVSLNRRR